MTNGLRRNPCKSLAALACAFFWNNIFLFIYFMLDKIIMNTFSCPMPNKKEQSATHHTLSDEERERLELCRKGYDDTASAQSTLLDKTIISISGAAYTIAIGFIDKIIPLGTAKYTWILWISLSILGLTIIATTLSFWAGEKSARKWREACDTAECKNDYNLFYAAKNDWVKVVCILNNVRLIFFICGIFLLSVFISYNGMIKKEVTKQKHGDTVMSDISNESQQERPATTLLPEGYNPPPPSPPPPPKEPMPKE